MEHIFGIIGGVSSNDILEKALDIIEESKLQIMSQSDGNLHTILTYGDNSESSLKVEENEDRVSFHFGEVIEAGKHFDSNVFIDYQTSKDADGCFVAGCVDASEGVAHLCTDPFGIFPLYHIAVGNGIVFGSSIDTIIRATNISLTLDIAGVAQFFHFDHFIGEHTFCNEIKRFPQGMELCYLHDGNLCCWNAHYSWPEETGQLIDDIDDAISLIRQSLMKSLQRRISGREDIICLLSGGFDSRMIAATLLHFDVKFTTHTAYGDQGRFFDPKGAELVATALGIPNQYYDLPQDYLEKYWKQKSVIVNHETPLHTWLIPMSRSLPIGSFNLDGLGGDVLIPGLKRVDMPKLSFSRIIGKEHQDEWQHKLNHSIEREQNCISVGPNLRSTMILRNRSRRGTGCSPTLLLSNRIQNSLPFMDRKFVEACFKIDDEIKSKDLYRQLIVDIAPILKEVPSSHDAVWPEHIVCEEIERFCTITAKPLDSYLKEIQEASNVISPFISQDWLNKAKLARDSSPEQRQEYLREVQSLGEISFFLRTYEAYFQ